VDTDGGVDSARGERVCQYDLPGLSASALAGAAANMPVRRKPLPDNDLIVSGDRPPPQRNRDSSVAVHSGVAKHGCAQPGTDSVYPWSVRAGLYCFQPTRRMAVDCGRLTASSG
jgi:hypothetical protein